MKMRTQITKMNNPPATPPVILNEVKDPAAIMSTKTDVVVMLPGHAPFLTPTDTPAFMRKRTVPLLLEPRPNPQNPVNG
jgi:hypothetical protein